MTRDHVDGAAIGGCVWGVEGALEGCRHSAGNGSGEAVMVFAMLMLVSSS